MDVEKVEAGRSPCGHRGKRLQCLMIEEIVEVEEGSGIWEGGCGCTCRAESGGGGREISCWLV